MAVVAIAYLVGGWERESALVVESREEFKQLLYLPASNGSEEVADDSILVIREVAMLYVWPQIVEPPQPAALAAPLQPCNARSFFRYTKPSWLNNASRHACYSCL